MQMIYEYIFDFEQKYRFFGRFNGTLELGLNWIFLGLNKIDF
jgi:hypothetical protein